MRSRRGNRRTARQEAGDCLIGYPPQSGTFDGANPTFRKIKIGLKSSDLKIRNRRRFCGIADGTPEL